MTSAASAWTSALIRSALPSGTPSTPLCSQRARNESPAASDQTIVDSRPTGMPSIAARSPRSAAARIARPVRVAPRNQATNAIAAGATIAATRSLALSTTPSTSKRQSRGTEIRSAANSRPHSRGVTIASATSSDVTPIVATVSTIRDALAEASDDRHLDHRTEHERRDPHRPPAPPSTTIPRTRRSRHPVRRAPSPARPGRSSRPGWRGRPTPARWPAAPSAGRAPRRAATTRAASRRTRAARRRSPPERPAHPRPAASPRAGAPTSPP